MKGREFKNAIYDGLSKLLKALSNPYRLEIIEMLSQGEKSVEGIVQVTGMSFANASQHLQVMKHNNIVKARKEGHYVYYSLFSDEFLSMYQHITKYAVREIIAKKNNIVFHTDASQSVGKIDTDVKKLGVDLLTIAGHKLYAPKGIGALYIKQGTRIENLMYGAGQENGSRPGTENVVHIVALGKACEIAQRDFDKNVSTMLSARERLLNGLKSKLGERIRVNGELSNTLPNTLSIAFDKTEAHTLASLISKEVYISTGSACHADSIEISSVLKAMNVNLMTAASTLRISTGKYTNEKEIDFAIESIVNAVHILSQ